MIGENYVELREDHVGILVLGTFEIWEVSHATTLGIVNATNEDLRAVTKRNVAGFEQRFDQRKGTHSHVICNETNRSSATDRRTHIGSNCFILPMMTESNRKFNVLALLKSCVRVLQLCVRTGSGRFYMLIMLELGAKRAA